MNNILKAPNIKVFFFHVQEEHAVKTVKLANEEIARYEAEV